MTRRDVQALLALVVVGAVMGAVVVGGALAVQWTYTFDLDPDRTAGALAMVTGLVVMLFGQLWIVPWISRPRPGEWNLSHRWRRGVRAVSRIGRYRPRAVHAR